MKRAARWEGLLVIVYGTQDIFLETQLAAEAAWTVITVVSPTAFAVVFDVFNASFFSVNVSTSVTFHDPISLLREDARKAFPEF